MDTFGESTEYADRPFLALIGDISRSRAAPDRAELQAALERALSAANDALGDALAARFTITLGDEFQGLLRDPGRAMGAIVRIEEWLPGVRVRYGLGWGRIATPLRPETRGMDGPCFHRARGALLRGKGADRWASVSGFGPREDAILDALFGLVGTIRGEWTKKQAATIVRVRRSATQREAARALEVSPSVVSESLKASHYRRVRDAEEAIARLLQMFGGPAESTEDSAEGANR